MISGILTVYPRMGISTYVDSKSKLKFRHLPCTTTDGLNITITINEAMFTTFQKEIMENVVCNKHKFCVWGEVKSVNKTTENLNITNLYIRANLMMPEKSDKEVNLFSINANATRTSIEDEGSVYFYVAANKRILNKYEKKNKPTYTYIKTNAKVMYENKDILQGTVKLINIEEELAFEAIHIVANNSSRLLMENFLPKYKEAS